MELGIKAIGFDLDGTFLKTRVDYDELYGIDRKVLASHDIPFEEIYGPNPDKKRLRAPIAEWLKEHGRIDEFQPISKEIDDLCTEVEVRHVDEAVPFPGSLECIDILHSKGLKVGLLTRGSLEYARKALSRFGVYDKMDAVMGRDHTCYDDAKPSPKAMTDFAGLLGVEASELLYLGDNVTDFHSARDAGSMFIGVLSGTATEETWESESPGMMTLDYAGQIAEIIDEF